MATTYRIDVGTDSGKRLNEASVTKHATLEAAISEADHGLLNDWSKADYCIIEQWSPRHDDPDLSDIKTVWEWHRSIDGDYINRVLSK